VAVADMFLKLTGVTGEASDKDHKGEIEVVSWSWGMAGTASSATGDLTGKARLDAMQVVKRVDQATPTLMSFLLNNKLVTEAQLTVRKAGTTPLEYFGIRLEGVRILSVRTESENTDLTERVSLGFKKVRVTYTPQGATGAQGGGTNQVEYDAHASDK
jgi:type VI secretion system secreted protein Hcp